MDKEIEDIIRNTLQSTYEGYPQEIIEEQFSKYMTTVKDLLESGIMDAKMLLDVLSGGTCIGNTKKLQDLGIILKEEKQCCKNY